MITHKLGLNINDQAVTHPPPQRTDIKEPKSKRLKANPTYPLLQQIQSLKKHLEHQEVMYTGAI